jgi:hypothetical protein
LNLHSIHDFLMIKKECNTQQCNIYHELGHDLLSLTHICAPGQHMTGWDSCDGDTSPLLHDGREINQQDIRYNSDDPVTDWNRATKDMFELNKQEYLYCD